MVMATAMADLDLAWGMAGITVVSVMVAMVTADTVSRGLIILPLITPTLR